MEARAQARYVRVTPMKARRVIDLIRGMQAGDAQDVLRFAPQAASEPVGKVLASAIANATNNHGMDARDLVVSQAFVDEGPTLKRIRPRAQGRAFRVGKRTSHITVILSDGTAVVEPVPAPKARASSDTADKAAPADEPVDEHVDEAVAEEVIVEESPAEDVVVETETETETETKTETESNADENADKNAKKEED